MMVRETLRVQCTALECRIGSKREMSVFPHGGCFVPISSRRNQATFRLF